MKAPRHDGSGWTLYDRDTAPRHRFSALPGADERHELWVGHGTGFLRLAGGEWRPDAGDASVVSGMPAGVERTATLYGGPREWMGAATRDGDASPAGADRDRRRPLQALQRTPRPSRRRHRVARGGAGAGRRPPANRISSPASAARSSPA